MGMFVRYIQADPRSGRLSYRRAYPAALRPFIFSSPREMVRALDGKSTKDAGVLSRYEAFHREYEEVVDRARKLASGRTTPLSNEDIPVLVETYARTILRSIRDTHFDENDSNRDWLWSPSWRFMPYATWDDWTAEQQGQTLPSRADRIRHLIPQLETTWRKAVADGDRQAVIEIEGENAEALMADGLISFDPASSPYFELCRSLLQRDLEILGGLARQFATGDMVEVPEALPDKVEQARQGIAVTLPKLAELLMASTTDPVSRTTKDAWNTALRYWQDVHGPLPYTSVTRAHVTTWLSQVAQRPAQLPRRLHATSLTEVLAAYSDKDVERIAGRTTAKHLSSLSSIWTKAESRGDIVGDRKNPFINHNIARQNIVGGNELTADELNAVLSLPVFTRHERPAGGRGEAAYWMPLLLLFTGCRPGEAAQLILEDFTEDDEGTLCIRYTDEGQHPLIGARRLKTSKRGTGKRRFPVPQALIDLGLKEYLTWLQKRGERALFPRFTATVKGLAEPWSRWWGPYVREAGAIPAGKRQAREFRHGFATAARASGISPEALAYMQGHTIGGTSPDYGSNEPLGAEIAKLNFKGLDLTKVARWKPPVG